MIKETIITDIEIMKQVIKEAKTKPSEEAVKRNQEAYKLLQKLRGC